MRLPEILTRRDGTTIAYHRLTGDAPGIVFLCGFHSDMTGNKALYLEDYCRRRRQAFVRFDHFGHGASSGEASMGTIGRWAEDAIAVLDSLTQGRQILVGSSMGGWIMLLAALARPARIGGAYRRRGGARFHRGSSLAAARPSTAATVARNRRGDVALRIRPCRIHLSNEPIRGRQAVSRHEGRNCARLPGAAPARDGRHVGSMADEPVSGRAARHQGCRGNSGEGRRPSLVARVGSRPPRPNCRRTSRSSDTECQLLICQKGCVEIEFGVERPLDVVGAAEAVLLAVEQKI